MKHHKQHCQHCICFFTDWTEYLYTINEKLCSNQNIKLITSAQVFNIVLDHFN